MSWESRRVLVTGGASFIGAALVDALVERGACLKCRSAKASKKPSSGT